jgi:hypothetical protein
MKRIISIEVHFDDGHEQRQRASREAKQAEIAAKAAASAVIRSSGFNVTDTSSSSTFEDRR